MSDTAVETTGAIESEDARLESLGYKPQLNRVLGFFANFAVAFTYLSPMVGIYSLYTAGAGDRRPCATFEDKDPGGRRDDAAGRARLRRTRQRVSRSPARSTSTASIRSDRATDGSSAGSTGSPCSRPSRRSIPVPWAYVTSLSKILFGNARDPANRTTIFTIAGDRLAILAPPELGRRDDMGGCRAARRVRREHRHVRRACFSRSTGFTRDLDSPSPRRTSSGAKSNPLGRKLRRQLVDGARWSRCSLTSTSSTASNRRAIFPKRRSTHSAKCQKRCATRCSTAASLLRPRARAVARDAGARPDRGDRSRAAVSRSSSASSRAGCRTSCSCSSSSRSSPAARRSRGPAAGSPSPTRGTARCPASGWISRVNSRFKTPVNALLAGAVVTVLFALLVYYVAGAQTRTSWFITYPANVNGLVALVSFGVSGIYLVVPPHGDRGDRRPGSRMGPGGDVHASASGDGRCASSRLVYLGLMLVNVVVPTGLTSPRGLLQPRLDHARSSSS